MHDTARFVVAVVVAVLRRGRVLAMRRSPRKDAGAGAWEALAGRVHPGEQPLAAARREAREECGLDVSIDPRPVASYQAKRNLEDMVVVVYRGVSDTGDVVLSDEHDAFAWMTLEEFSRACRFPLLVEAVRLASKASSRRARRIRGPRRPSGPAPRGRRRRTFRSARRAAAG